MIYNHKCRVAFTLIEILTVMAGLTVVMGMMGAILAGMLRIQKASQKSLERTLARSELADQFRADVAGSRSVLKDLGDFHSGEACLILRGNKGCIVYRLQDGRVERQDTSMDGTVLHTTPLGPQTEQIRFTRHEDNSRLVAMYVEQSVDKPHERRTCTYKATLGGKWR